MINSELIQAIDKNPQLLESMKWSGCDRLHSQVKFRGDKCPVCSLLLLLGRKDKEIECLKESNRIKAQMMVDNCENHPQAGLIFRGPGYVPVTDY